MAALSRRLLLVAAGDGLSRPKAHDDGRYSFRSLKPAASPGRALHIHPKVETPESGKFTTQFYLAGDPRTEGDVVGPQVVRGNPRHQAMIEMRLEPANGLEPGALATWMDIVTPSSPPRA